MLDIKIPVTEIFYSLQGEGLYTGVPSIFIRFFGCNFTCAGFGMPKGQISTEYLNVNPKDYTDVKDLPLVNTGCDSYAAWDPRFKHLQKQMTIEEIVEEVIRLTPVGAEMPHIIFTGGEPLLKGRQKHVAVLMYALLSKSYTHFTFETNGTQKLVPEMEELSEYLVNVTFSVSAKLSSSGESRNRAIVPEAVKSYALLSRNTFFKFVVSHPDDIEEVDEVLKIYREANVRYDSVYIMPVGGVNDVYEANWRWVAEKCLKKGYRFSQRLQVPLFRNAWGA